LFGDSFILLHLHGREDLFGVGPVVADHPPFEVGEDFPQVGDPLLIGLECCLGGVIYYGGSSSRRRARERRVTASTTTTIKALVEVRVAGGAVE